MRALAGVGLILVGMIVLTSGCGGRQQGTRSKVVIDGTSILILDAQESSPIAIHFQHDSAVLDESAAGPLDALAAFMVANDDLPTVEVHGHTDESGTPTYNEQLSLKRANAVIDRLVQSGVKRDRLRARGFGASRPAAAAGDAAENRRVEFIIAGSL